MIEIKERQFDFGPQRASWTFKIPVKDLKAAVLTQQAYHQKRYKYWKIKRGIAAGKEKRSLTAETMQVTGGQQTIYKSDPAAVQAKALADAKMNQHRIESDRLREWYKLLTYASEEETRWCTVEDAIYFGLTGYVPE